MPVKEYTFQCIISYEEESEEEARQALENDLRQNGNRLFECIQVKDENES